MILISNAHINKFLSGCLNSNGTSCNYCFIVTHFPQDSWSWWSHRKGRSCPRLLFYYQVETKWSSSTSRVRFHEMQPELQLSWDRFDSRCWTWGLSSDLMSYFRTHGNGRTKSLRVNQCNQMSQRPQQSADKKVAPES